MTGADQLKTRPCTCHPDDQPPVPCVEKYALSDCQKAANKTRPFDPNDAYHARLKGAGWTRVQSGHGTLWEHPNLPGKTHSLPMALNIERENLYVEYPPHETRPMCPACHQVWVRCDCISSQHSSKAKTRADIKRRQSFIERILENAE